MKAILINMGKIATKLIKASKKFKIQTSTL